MSTTDQRPAAKRRGRRPAGQDTRAALLRAAREVFADSGYEGTTVRAIAARAGVDAAMVNHWFGGKEGLFAQAVLKLPIDTQPMVSKLLEGDRNQLGERVIRSFLTTWDTSCGGVFPALVRSLAGHREAAARLRDFVIKNILGPVVASLRSDNPQLRANLCASQLIGIGLARYVVKFDPLATADVDTVVAAVAPTLQRYLTGDLGLPDQG